MLAYYSSEQWTSILLGVVYSGGWFLPVDLSNALYPVVHGFAILVGVLDTTYHLSGEQRQ